MSIPFDITFHPSWYHKNCGVNFTRDFFDDPQTRIEADIAMRRVLYEKFGDYGIGEADPKPRPILGSDLLAAGYLYSAILGCDILYSENNSPVVVCRNMSDEEVAELTVPDLDSNPLWQNVQSQIDWLKEHYGHVIPCTNLMGIQNIAIDLRGTDIFFDYMDDPDLAHHLLDVCTKLSIDIGHRFRALDTKMSAGVTAIVKQTRPDVYLTSNCTVELVSQDVYEEFLLPYDIKLAKEFPEFAIHHCGQTMEHIVNGYAKVPNLKFAEVGAGSDLAKVRSVLPDVYLNARYSPARLKNVTEDELRSELAALHKNGGDESLLSISCVGIDSEATDEQVLAFLKAASEL